MYDQDKDNLLQDVSTHLRLTWTLSVGSVSADMAAPSWCAEMMSRCAIARWCAMPSRAIARGWLCDPGYSSSAASSTCVHSTVRLSATSQTVRRQQVKQNGTLVTGHPCLISLRTRK